MKKLNELSQEDQLLEDTLAMIQSIKTDMRKLREETIMTIEEDQEIEIDIMMTERGLHHEIEAITKKGQIDTKEEETLTQESPQEIITDLIKEIQEKETDITEDTEIQDHNLSKFIQQ